MIQLYHTLKQQQQRSDNDNNKNDFEVVFCSSDMMSGPFHNYAAQMPWWSLPLHHSAIVQRLSTVYQACGIPHLTVLDTDGSVLHADAIDLVRGNNNNNNSIPTTPFPWRPQRLVDLLPEQYLHANGGRAPMSSLDSKYLLVYASASWCPAPCQERITPRVVQMYQLLTAQRTDVEVRRFVVVVVVWCVCVCVCV